MNPSNSRQGHQRAFLWVVLGSLVLAVGYTAWVILRSGASAQAQGPLPAAAPGDLAAIQSGPHLLYLNQEEANMGNVKVVSLDPEASASAQTSLACGRVHYAGSNGLCLTYDPSVSGALAQPQIFVTLFGPDFQPRQQSTIEGVLSRARVSPDGKYAAYTVFITGHSYEDANMSTATVLLDAASGASLAGCDRELTARASIPPRPALRVDRYQRGLSGSQSACLARIAETSSRA